MRIAMANDHAGTQLKNQIKAWLEGEGHEVVDFGTYDEEGCDLSDYIYPASMAVAKGECERGIFVDGVAVRPRFYYGSAPCLCPISEVRKLDYTIPFRPEEDAARSARAISCARGCTSRRGISTTSS